jgi:hypothetical protein
MMDDVLDFQNGRISDLDIEIDQVAYLPLQASAPRTSSDSAPTLRRAIECPLACDLGTRDMTITPGYLQTKDYSGNDKFAGVETRQHPPPP